MEWYYAKNRETFGPFSQEEMHSYFVDGIIGIKGIKTSVWSEENDTWVSYDQTTLYIAPRKSGIPPPLPKMPTGLTPPTQHERQQGNSTYKYQPKTLHTSKYNVAANTKNYVAYEGKGLARMISILLLLSLISSAFQGYVILKANGAQAKFVATQFSELNPSFALLDAGIALVAIVCVFIWMYQRTSTIWAKQGPQTITPAGAVYWFFVPIMWFFKPYQAMSNIVQKNNKSQLQSSVNLWWGLFWGSAVIAFTIGFMGGGLENVKTLNEANTYANWAIIIHGVDVVGLFILKHIVDGVSGIGWGTNK